MQYLLHGSQNTFYLFTWYILYANNIAFLLQSICYNKLQEVKVKSILFLPPVDFNVYFFLSKNITITVVITLKQHVSQEE